MEKTTVYLPPELKAEITRAARLRAVPEAEVIRDAIRAAVGYRRPAPRPGLFSAEPMAEKADEILAGFGER